MFDLVVFCVGQDMHTDSIPQNTNIYITTEERYFAYWKFMTQEQGCWYNLYVSADEFAGTRICVHLEDEPVMELPWLDEQAQKEYAECLTPYLIDNAFKDSFKAILSYLLDQSPQNKIYVLARYQSSEFEITMGTYKLETFLELMKNKRIYANVCYILTKNENAL